MDLAWWITVIGVPLVGSIFGTIWGVWYISASARSVLDAKIDASNKDLYEHKIQVSMHYATIMYTKDVEVRLVAALNRIEGKLDRIIERAENRVASRA